MAISEDGSPSPVVVDVIEFACPNDTGLSVVEGFEGLTVFFVKGPELFLLIGVVLGDGSHGSPVLG